MKCVHDGLTIRNTSAARMYTDIKPKNSLRHHLKVTFLIARSGNRCQIEPGWHAWMSYLVDKPPTEDPLIKTAQRVWELPEHRQNLTASRGAYKPYCT